MPDETLVGYDTDGQTIQRRAHVSIPGSRRRWFVRAVTANDDPSISPWLDLVGDDGNGEERIAAARATLIERPAEYWQIAVDAARKAPWAELLDLYVSVAGTAGVVGRRNRAVSRDRRDRIREIVDERIAAVLSIDPHGLQDLLDGRYPSPVPR
jgi:hypothetical protein